jgi:cyclophilin family peptidyl-prolyl cis-trans isomerase
MAMQGMIDRCQAPQRCLAPLLAPLCILLVLVLALPLAATAQESPSLEPRVRFQTTVGDFVIEVDTLRAPLTSANFLSYVREGFYDQTIIHRVVPNFVVQGGGFGADLSAKTGHGPIPNESGNGLYNSRGTVGMARGDTPHSATSQFYVNLNDNAGLNPLPSRWGYAVFGRVVEGMGVIDQIAHVVTGQRGPFGADAPLKDILITHAQVVGETPPATPAAAPPPPPTANGAESGEPGESAHGGAAPGEAQEEPPAGDAEAEGQQATPAGESPP